MTPRDDANELDSEGMPDHGESSAPEELVPPPRDFPQGAREATTPAEQRVPEPVAERARRELPEDDGVVDLEGDEIGAPVGRLLDDADADGVDSEKDVVSLDTGDDLGLSAEEAAMHITSEP